MMSILNKQPKTVTVTNTVDGAMSVQTAIQTRRSTRKYAEKPVEKELVEKVIEAGRYAPSGGNSQTTHFIAITNHEGLDELAGSRRPCQQEGLWQQSGGLFLCGDEHDARSKRTRPRVLLAQPAPLAD